MKALSTSLLPVRYSQTGPVTGTAHMTLSNVNKKFLFCSNATLDTQGVRTNV